MPAADVPPCPRCASPGALLATSPVAGAWELYACAVCCFSWRSTEPAATIDPERYPANFRVIAANVAAMPDFPVIPAAFRKRGQ
jgi:hypothetical protein